MVEMGTSTIQTYLNFVFGPCSTLNTISTPTGACGTCSQLQAMSAEERRSALSAMPEVGRNRPFVPKPCRPGQPPLGDVMGVRVGRSWGFWGDAGGDDVDPGSSFGPECRSPSVSNASCL